MPSLTVGAYHVVEAVSVIDINKERADSYMKERRKEENLVTLTQDSIASKIDLETDNLSFKFRRTDTKKGSRIKVNSKTVDLQLEANFDGTHESFFWVTPLDEDLLTEFHTWKRAGIPLEPFKYNFEGKEYSCESKKCFMTTD